MHVLTVTEEHVKRFHELDDKSQRGSKPRCHLLTDGTRTEVADRLNRLVEPYGSVKTYNWMPVGLKCPDEVQLHNPNTFITHDMSANLKKWWFADRTGRGPTWDLVSECFIGSGNGAIKGVLLVEAKAHWAELKKESEGKTLRTTASRGSRCNHDQIGNAIKEANIGLSAITNDHTWALSRDNCYQISNRFSWAWKLVDLGVPVVLVYLGFLHAVEMSDQGKPFSDHADWVDCVKTHSKHRVPEKAWERDWKAPNGTAFVPRIMSSHQSLTAARMSR